MRNRRWLLSLLLAGSMLLAGSGASAEDTLKVAIGQLGLWAVDAPRLGQRAGIFKKHGLVLDIFGTSGGGETLQAVISGSADLTVGIGTAAVLRAYSKGAPIRVIGANFTGAGDLYWYVRADSAIKRLTDANDKTSIGYSASGSSSHNVVLAFLQELGVKATPTATGTQPATLTQVMSGQIDIGWSAPPFGLKELAQGKIRIIANGNDVPSLRSQTVRVDMVNADVLNGRRDALLRFVRAYRETLDWMFSSPDPVKIYAEEANVPVELAATTRDKFQTKEAMRNDRLSDLDAVMAQAVRLKFLDELGVEIIAPGLIESALDQGKRDRRRRGELHAELVRLRHQVGVVERFPNEAPSLGLVRGERLGRKRKPAGASGTDQPWQEPGAPAIGDEADLGEGLHEARRARRQYDVAGERDIGAGAGRDAVDGGNYRERQRAQLAHERVVIGVERAPEHGCLAVCGHALAQILSGAEGAAGAGQQERAAVAILLGLGERALERLLHRLVDRVELPRPVQRDDAIARAPLDQDRCVFHGRLLVNFASRDWAAPS